jgi:hypothetical protein
MGDMFAARCVFSRAKQGLFRESQDNGKMKHQALIKGLVRLHILHHASEEEFYGQGITINWPATATC